MPRTPAALRPTGGHEQAGAALEGIVRIWSGGSSVESPVAKLIVGAPCRGEWTQVGRDGQGAFR